jgi:hypothetical protein
MPEKETLARARKDKREGKAASTQAGEFVREEMHHLEEGKHGATSPQQAIAIGLSKARRAGIDLPPPEDASPATRRKAERDEEIGQSNQRPRAHRAASRNREAPMPSKDMKRDQDQEDTGRSRSRSRSTANDRDNRDDPDKGAPEVRVGPDRVPESKHVAGKQAAETKGPEVREEAAKKGARTRASKAKSR